MLVTDTGDSMYWSPFSPIFAVKTIFLVYQGFFQIEYFTKSSQKRQRRSSYINPGICAHCSYRNTFENGGTMETFTETINQPQAKTQQEV